MRAVGYKRPGAIDRDDALVDIELPKPVPHGRDILVEVRAVSVNPVDTKVRKGTGPEGQGWKVLGWDAAGVVAAVGSEATLFAPGDAVFYAGAIGRPGTNAEFHLVDERIVGSIAIQLVRALTDLTVVASASRPETTAWVTAAGAHHVVDHAEPLAAQVAAPGIGAPAFVFSTTQTGRHLADIAALIAPQGRFALIDDPATLDVNAFKRKSASVHWEFMFTRSMFDTPDIGEQGRLLDEVSHLVEEGVLRSTLSERLTPIDATNLKRVHALIESGTERGKIVLEGFGASASSHA